MSEIPSPPKKQWIMNAFAMSSPGHLNAGLWRHPSNRSGEYTNLEYWTDLAKILEAGKFHGLFIADMLGIYDVYKGPDNIVPAIAGAAQFPISDPMLPIAAMAAVTKSLSFGITASTTYEQPFILARRFATLDHLTNGRVAWNIVTSYLENAARNLGLNTQVPHDERYRIADEYLRVFYKLLEGSWRDDAVVKSQITKQYADPDRIRRIDHQGKYFSVAGPHAVEPSRQRTPFIFQAGTSSAGKDFAVNNAEAMFVPGMDVDILRASITDIRARAAKAGRNPSSIKFIVGITVIVDETDEKAQEKYEEYLTYADLEGSAALFGGWTGTDISKFADDEDLSLATSGGVRGIVDAWSATIPGSKTIRWNKERVARELAIGGAHARAIGGPKTVADILERWIADAGADGFNLGYAVSPGGFEDMIKHLWPELRRRGVFHEDYEVPGGTTRENYTGDGLGSRLRDDHPGSRYRWQAGQDVPPYTQDEQLA